MMIQKNSSMVKMKLKKKDIIYLFGMDEFDTDSEDKDVKEDELYISLTVLFVLDLLNCILFFILINT